VAEAVPGTSVNMSAASAMVALHSRILITNTPSRWLGKGITAADLRVPDRVRHLALTVERPDACEAAARSPR
jgi:hypothetical protein